jgi:hypothetical protein
MADWVAISSLATAGGTLALAATTYASVRSANRAARAAETSLLAGLRPLLVESSEGDPPLRVGFYDVRGIVVPGGRTAVEIVDDNLYIVVSLRNVGTGIAVLHGGLVHPGRRTSEFGPAAVEDFTRLTRDIYIPPGKVGFWQIAFRDDTDERRELLDAVEAGALSIELLYGDYEGGQRVVSRYGILREEDGAWHTITALHHQVDRDDPRPRPRG